MTEAEWLACEVPVLLADAAHEMVSERKYRLLAVACCRRLRRHVEAPLWFESIQTAELAADGLIGPQELRLIFQDVVATFEQAGFSRGTPENDGILLNTWSGMAIGATCRNPRSEMIYNVFSILDVTACALLRDIFGNPFRSVAFSSEWRTDTAVALARTMYESREFSAMPILADALQDAGCDSDDILNHCQGDGPHVRGCWVVDLVLGKE